MPIKIANERSKEIITNLLLRDFHKIDFSMEHIYNAAPPLIRTATDYGLFDCVKQMEDIKQTEQCY